MCRRINRIGRTIVSIILHKDIFIIKGNEERNIYGGLLAARLFRILLDRHYD